MKLNFKEGLLIGSILSISIFSVVLDKFFISRDSLKLGEIYIDGKLYKICKRIEKCSP